MLLTNDGHAVNNVTKLIDLPYFYVGALFLFGLDNPYREYLMCRKYAKSFSVTVDLNMKDVRKRSYSLCPLISVTTACVPISY